MTRMLILESSCPLARTSLPPARERALAQENHFSKIVKLRVKRQTSEIKRVCNGLAHHITFFELVGQDGQVNIR